MSERLEKQAGQPEHLLEVRDLKQYFPIHTGWFQNTPLKAVDGVSFTIDPKTASLSFLGKAAAAKPLWAGAFCTCTSLPAAK